MMREKGVRMPNRANRWLGGFKKVYNVSPGETKVVELEIQSAQWSRPSAVKADRDRRAARARAWRLPAGASLGDVLGVHVVVIGLPLRGHGTQPEQPEAGVLALCHPGTCKLKQQTA
eukprot:COSAG02_NODE_25977_length_644_cov_0.774312_1_plen_117_part_00